MRNCRACQRNTTHLLPMASGDDFFFSIIYIFFSKMNFHAFAISTEENAIDYAVYKLTLTLNDKFPIYYRIVMYLRIYERILERTFVMFVC